MLTTVPFETKTTLKEFTGLSTSRLDAAIAVLLSDKLICKTKVTKGNNRPYDAYKLASLEGGCEAS